MVPNLAFVGGLVVDSRRSKFHVADPNLDKKRVTKRKKKHKTQPGLEPWTTGTVGSGLTTVLPLLATYFSTL